MTEQRVTVTITDGVADVRLNRPDKRNALDNAMFAGLITAGERLKTEPGVRAVVLSGEGPDFCAGLDFGAFQAMRDGERLSLQVDLPPAEGPARATGQRAAYVWAELPVPVIAAVTGNALGGGLQIALGADIRIVTPDARLSVLEIRWGLIPDMTGSQLLPELVGRDVAKELTFSGRVVSGTEAVALGLATRTDPDPRAAALELARGVAARSPHAIRAAKRLLDMAGRVDLAAGFAAEQKEIGALIGSPNQVEAVAAEFGKRPPEFADPACGLPRGVGPRSPRASARICGFPGRRPTQCPEPPTPDHVQDRFAFDPSATQAPAASANRSSGPRQPFENPKTRLPADTAFVYPDGTKGTDLYLSVTSRETVPPNPYRR